jgi:hypothetical protein
MEAFVSGEFSNLCGVFSQNRVGNNGYARNPE